MIKIVDESPPDVPKKTILFILQMQEQ